MQKFLIIASLLTCLPSSAYAQTSAEDTVRKIVTIQADAVNKNSTGCCWLPWIDDKGPTPIMQKYYTHDFIEVWKCALKVNADYPVWDGDFIIGAQGLTHERLMSVQPAKIKESTALVNVSIEGEGEGAKGISHMQFSLRREDDEWKVDDIINLDDIAYDKKRKTPYIEASQREAFKADSCK